MLELDKICWHIQFQGYACDKNGRYKVETIQHYSQPLCCEVDSPTIDYKYMDLNFFYIMHTFPPAISEQVFTIHAVKT